MYAKKISVVQGLKNSTSNLIGEKKATRKKEGWVGS